MQKHRNRAHHWIHCIQMEDSVNHSLWMPRTSTQWGKTNRQCWHHSRFCRHGLHEFKMPWQDHRQIIMLAKAPFNDNLFHDKNERHAWDAGLKRVLHAERMNALIPNHSCFHPASMLTLMAWSSENRPKRRLKRESFIKLSIRFMLTACHTKESDRTIDIGYPRLLAKPNNHHINDMNEMKHLWAHAFHGRLTDMMPCVTKKTDDSSMLAMES